MTRWKVAICLVAAVAASGALRDVFRPSSDRADEVERPSEVLGTAVARAFQGADETSAPAAVALAEAPSPASHAGEVIPPPPAAFEGAAGPARRVRRPATVSPRVLPEGEGGTWALVVGINDYPGDGHDLRFAVNDADDVDSVLEGLGVPSDHRVVLRDGQATSAAIVSSIDWLLDHAGPDAVAVVSFAGHARKHGADRQSFVAADGIELSDQELATRLRPLRARSTWLNFATCYAGGFDELLAGGRTLVAAAAAGQLAYENTAIGRSYLGEYMVRRALRSSTDGDVRAAFAAAREAIRRDYPERVPVELTSAVDLVVRLRPPPSPASEPDPGPALEPGNDAPSSPTGQPDTCADVTLGVISCR